MFSLGVSNFGNAKLSSAEKSAWGHETCYKIKYCSIIFRHFTETINLCESVEP